MQIYAFQYSYDAANNRTKRRRETGEGIEWDSTYYAYDDANALIRRLDMPANITTYYYYDANGALTTLVEGGSPTYFSYDANQLISAIKPPAEAATYFYYDGRLNRYGIDKAGVFTYYLWDGLRQLEERDASGNLNIRYTHGKSRHPGIGSIVEMERHVGVTTYFQYPLMDHRGTVYAITDQNQNIQLLYSMDSFGRFLAAIGGADPNVPNDVIYQSNWLTLQIGGRWYGISRYRIYDFELGIFLQRDFLPYLNKYRAFSNNPVKQIDRNGLGDVDERTKKQRYDEALERLKTARGQYEAAEKDGVFKDFPSLAGDYASDVHAAEGELASMSYSDEKVIMETLWSDLKIELPESGLSEALELPDQFLDYDTEIPYLPAEYAADIANFIRTPEVSKSGEITRQGENPFLDEPNLQTDLIDPISDFESSDLEKAIKDLRGCVNVIVRHGYNAKMVNVALGKCDYLFILAHGDNTGNAPCITTSMPGSKDKPIKWWTAKTDMAIRFESCFGEDISDYINKKYKLNSKAVVGSKGKKVSQRYALLDLIQQIKQLKVDIDNNPPQKRLKVCIFIGFRFIPKSFGMQFQR